MDSNRTPGKTGRRYRCAGRMLFAAACASCAMPAIADDRINPQITYDCDSEADVITITNSLLKHDTDTAAETADDRFSPWDLVEIDRKPDHTTIIRSSKIERRCTLSSGEYKVTIEPQIFNHDLGGQCGDNISGAVTVYHDGVELLERTPFEDYCFGNAPIIIRITVFGKTGEYKITRIPKYKFY